MISLKRYWTARDDCRCFAVDHYLALLEQLQHWAVALPHSEAGAPLASEIQTVRNELTPDPQPERFARTQEQVTAALRLCNERLAAFLKAREDELSEVFAFLSDTMSGVASDADRHSSRLSEFTGALQQIRRCRTLGETRSRLGQEVVQLCSYVAQMKHENVATVRAFEQQLQELRNRLHDAEQAASTDPLTGLLNRREGQARLEDAVRSGAEFAVMMLDLNRFKQINDRWGHGCGDQVLRIFAKKLQKAASMATMACRWGGDEFLLIFQQPLPDFPSLKVTIREALIGEYTIVAVGKEFPVHIDACIGTAEHQRGETLEALLGRADEDLYASKGALLLH
jgi:diguanylate cyclase (GGDEF)-like protein